jgi:2-methylcitrate dehydratase PrpD
LRHRDGTVFRKHVAVPKGAPDRPLDAAFLLRKHETTAVPAIGQARFNALRAALDSLETLPDFRVISRLLAEAA